MKKIILGMVFVFTTVTMVNAKTSEEMIENFEEIVLTKDCAQEVWDFGTGWDNGDPYWEWYWTDRYYSWCMEQ